SARSSISSSSVGGYRSAAYAINSARIQLDDGMAELRFASALGNARRGGDSAGRRAAPKAVFVGHYLSRNIRGLAMSIQDAAIGVAAARMAFSVPGMVLAQAQQGAPARRLSPELEALNPPVPDDIVIPEERRVPAERKVAAYNDPSWVAPRTSWGHPNLEGTFATDDMRGIPFDRPVELGTQEFLTDEQFIERAKRQQAGRDHSANVQTFHRNEWGVRSFGFSSLVVDPPDGRTPALTEHGRERAAVAARQGTFGPGTFDTFEDFSLYDRCIARGLAAGMTAVLYCNGIVIKQSPDSVTI